MPSTQYFSTLPYPGLVHGFRATVFDDPDATDFHLTEVPETLLKFVTETMPRLFQSPQPVFEPLLPKGDYDHKAMTLVQQAIFTAHVQELEVSDSGDTGLRLNLAPYCTGKLNTELDLASIHKSNAVLAFSGGKDSYALLKMFGPDRVTPVHIEDSFAARKVDDEKDYWKPFADIGGVKRGAVLDNCRITPTYANGSLAGSIGYDTDFGYGQPVPIALIQRLLLWIYACKAGKSYVFFGDEAERQQMWIANRRIWAGHGFFQTKAFYALLNQIDHKLPHVTSPLASMSQGSYVPHLVKQKVVLNSCSHEHFGRCDFCPYCRSLEMMRSYIEDDPVSLKARTIHDLDLLGYRLTPPKAHPVFSSLYHRSLEFLTNPKFYAEIIQVVDDDLRLTTLQHPQFVTFNHSDTKTLLTNLWNS